MQIVITRGGISYLEDLCDGDDSITNLLNSHDTGRLIQQSYYGTNSAPYKPANYNRNTWYYNPVQGGDQHNNRFIDFSGYTHRNAHQELPAFYTISYLSNFVYYAGNQAWSGDTLTTKADLAVWAGNTDAYFKLKSRETWGAWVAPTGYGIEVYTPIARILLAGRHQYNGSKDAPADAINYVAPLSGTFSRLWRNGKKAHFLSTPPNQFQILRLIGERFQTGKPK